MLEENDNKKIRKLIYLTGILGLFFLIVMGVNNMYIAKEGFDEKIVSAENMVFSFDYLKRNKLSNFYSPVVIEGWVYKKNISISAFNTQIGLQPKSNPKIIYLVKSLMVKRPDVTSHFDDGSNYDLGGFYSKFNSAFLPRGKYRIYIWYENDNQNILVPTSENFEI